MRILRIGLVLGMAAGLAGCLCGTHGFGEAQRSIDASGAATTYALDLEVVGSVPSDLRMELRVDASGAGGSEVRLALAEPGGTVIAETSELEPRLEVAYDTLPAACESSCTLDVVVEAAADDTRDMVLAVDATELYDCEDRFVDARLSGP